jgi:hypothetical protein
MDVMQFLVNYPWVIALAGGIAVGLALIFGLVRSAAGISRVLGEAKARLFTRAGFFWTVNFVFMAISVLHAGVFFGVTGGMAAYLGFAVSFFLDLVTIVLMQAMLEARYRGENGRARLLLLFIAVCCLTSTFANLAISLNSFKPDIMLHDAPSWVQVLSPYVLASFPLFVILMSIASEMIVNVRPMDSLDEGEYEIDEQKRVNILAIRNTYLQRQADEELRMFTIRAQMRANRAMRKGNVQKSFRWPWEKALQIDLVVAGVVKQIETLYESKVTALSEQNGELLAQVESQLSSTLVQAQSIESLYESKVTALSEQNEQFLKLVESQLSSTLVQAQSIESLCESKVTALSQQNGQVLEQVKNQLAATLTQVQSLAYGDGVEDDNAVATPYSEELVNDIQGLLASYPILLQWLSTGQRSVTIEDIVKVTGHTPRMVKNRIEDRTILRTKRLGSYRVDSVVRWLKVAPLPKSKDHETTASIPVVNSQNTNRSEQNGRNGHSKDTIKLDQLEYSVVS